jgi:hypothetical protein
METTTNNQSLDNKPNNSKLYIALGILAAAGIAAGAYFFMNNEEKEIKAIEPAITVNDTIAKTDSITSEEKDLLEKNGFYASENYIIANKAMLRRTPNEAQNNVIDSLKFGTKVYTKSVYFDEEGGGESGDETLLANEKKNGFVAIYNTKPTKLSDQPVGYISEKVFVEQYEFENYKKYFSLKEFAFLDSKIKKAIMDNSYFENVSYYLTQNSQRSPYVLCKGDYDGDGLKDFAVILDNVEKEYSSILIFLTNKVTKEPYLAYRKAYTDYFKVKTVTKGSNVIKDSEPYVLTTDAVMMTGGEYTPQLFVYERDTNKFIPISQE